MDALDSPFSAFFYGDDKLLAPRGGKRIGGAFVIDEKCGCTVLPTMDMTSSSLLPPLIIFNGGSGRTITRVW